MFSLGDKRNVLFFSLFSWPELQPKLQWAASRSNLWLLLPSLVCWLSEASAVTTPRFHALCPRQYESIEWQKVAAKQKRPLLRDRKKLCASQTTRMLRFAAKVKLGLKGPTYFFRTPVVTSTLETPVSHFGEKVHLYWGRPNVRLLGPILGTQKKPF
jgi:hypothetical protein